MKRVNMIQTLICIIHCLLLRFNAPVDVMPGGMGKPGESDKRHMSTSRILRWPYQIILILGNSEIEFCNKSGCGP